VGVTFDTSGPSAYQGATRRKKETGKLGRWEVCSTVIFKKKILKQDQIVFSSFFFYENCLIEKPLDPQHCKAEIPYCCVASLE